MFGDTIFCNAQSPVTVNLKPIGPKLEKDGANLQVYNGLDEKQPR